MLADLKSKLHPPKPFTRPPLHGPLGLAQPWVKLMCCVRFLYPLVRTLVRSGASWPPPLLRVIVDKIVDESLQTPDTSSGSVSVSDSLCFQFSRHVSVCVYAHVFQSNPVLTSVAVALCVIIKQCCSCWHAVPLCLPRVFRHCLSQGPEDAEGAQGLSGGLPPGATQLGTAPASRFASPQPSAEPGKCSHIPPWALGHMA